MTPVSRSPGGTLLGALCGLLGWATLAAAAPAIENVLISRTDGAAQIELRFACANRYVLHAPAVAAMRIEVSLERLDRCGGTPMSEASRPRAGPWQRWRNSSTAPAVVTMPGCACALPDQ